jgi:hypothetical protein
MTNLANHVESTKTKFGVEATEIHKRIDYLLSSHTLNFNHRSNHEFEKLFNLLRKEFPEEFLLSDIIKDHLRLDELGLKPGKMHGFYPGKRRPEDYYVTPDEAIIALLDREGFGGKGWEPASGNGAIVKFFPAIMASDIRKDPDVVGEKGIDFLMENRQVDFIITNPPFKLGLAFAEHALKSAKKVALFLRIQFLESKSRYQFFKINPPVRVYVFVNRISCLDENGKPLGSLMPFAWFIWERGFKGKPALDWILTK